MEILLGSIGMIIAMVLAIVIISADSHEDKLRRETMGMIHLGSPKPNYRPPSQINPSRPMILYGEPDIRIINRLDSHEPIEITTYGDKEPRYLNPIGWSGDKQLPEKQEPHDVSESWRAVAERKPLTEWQKNRGAELNMTYDEYHTKGKEMRDTLNGIKKELEAGGLCKEMTS